MASLFKQTITRPLPAGAELFTRNGKRFARWTVRGKTRTAKVTGTGDGLRIQLESGTWYARIRMAATDAVVDVATGCRDKTAAASRMAELVAEQERIRAGVVTQREANTAKHGHRLYTDTVTAFIDSMTARGCVKSTRRDWRYYLESAGRDGLGWRTLRDMDRAELERYLSMRAVTPKDKDKPESVMGARVHNAHVTAFVAFGAWCARQGYVKVNPFAGTAKRDERADRRHIRRALTVDELARLLDAARTRPMRDALKGNAGGGCKGGKKGKMNKEVAEPKDKTKDALRWLGETRAMAYWTAAATGLRWNELRSITLGAVRLDAEPPHLILEAKNEKARRGAQIAIQADLAAALRLYLAERRSRLVGACSGSIVEFPGALDTVPLFDVPKNMCRTFDADCAMAKVPKRDSAGRVVDVHALRHTFGTMLARAGVSLQVAQRAMRHSTPALTANVYTHLGLLDTSAAVNALPSIKAAHSEAAEKAVNSVTLNVTPDFDEDGQNGGIFGDSAPDRGENATTDKECVLTPIGAGPQGLAREGNGGRHRTRTCDILRVRQAL